MDSSHGRRAKSDGRRWPRKNTADQIAERQSRLRGMRGWMPAHEVIFERNAALESYARFIETITATASLPVAVLGPLRVSLGRYSLDPVDGALVEAGRDVEEVYVPLAHSEGGLSASMQRGIAAVLEGEPVVTHLVRDRITRASCSQLKDTREAVGFS